MSPDTNSGHRISIIKNSTTITVYRDGTSAASGTVSLNTPSNTALEIGSDNAAGNLLPGNIAEILIYNTALSTTSRTQLETSQTNYYGQ